MKKVIATSLIIMITMLFVVSPVAAKPDVTLWHVPGDFATIQDAIDSPDVHNGDKIMVGAGNHAGAVVTKSVVIKGTDGATITSGVPYKSGSTYETAFLLDTGSDGVEISHLIIANDATSLFFFAVFSRGIDDVSIHHLVVTNSVQAISNYNGSGWDISYNRITGTNPVNGGGIGIMVNAWDGTSDNITDTTVANDNVITHNYTEGAVGDVGYSGPGILLSSGHGSYQYPGGTLTGNIVYKNKCVHTGTNGYGFEVDDVPYELTGTAAITGNTVAFNDFRGSTYAIVWYGDETLNSVSRNFIDQASDRGEGKDGLTPHEIFH